MIPVNNFDILHRKYKFMIKIEPNKRNKIIGFVIIIIIIFIIFSLLNKNKEPEYSYAEVKKGTIIEEISATGTVKAVQDISLRFKVGGVVEKIYVKEGQDVKAGDLLIKLDTGEFYSQYLQAKADYKQAKAELDKLLVGPSEEEVRVAEQTVEKNYDYLQDTKKKAEVDLAKDYDDAVDAINNAYFYADKAMKKLNTIFDENTLYKDYRSDLVFRDIEMKYHVKEEKNKADIAFTEFKNIVSEIKAYPEPSKLDDSFEEVFSNLEVIRDTLDSASLLIDLVIIYEDYSQTQWDTDKDNIEAGRTAINTAITDVLNAKQAIEEQKITNQKNINTAENDYKKAVEELNKLKAKPRDVEIAIYQAKVDKAYALLLEAQKKLSDATLTSPINGKVAKINIKIGELVTANGDSVISLISSNKFEIEADISEADIGKVEIGDPVLISLDAFPEKIYAGRVGEIEPVETIIEGVVYYRTTIVFDELEKGIKPGMSADVTIQTDKKENVLYIPYRALIYKDSKKFVRVLEGDEIKEKEVKTGIRDNEGNIEIVEGLKEKEKIVTYTRER